MATEAEGELEKALSSGPSGDLGDVGGDLRALSTRAWAVQWLVVLTIVAAIALIISTIAEIRLLNRARDGLTSLAEAEASDRRQLVIALVSRGLLLLAGVSWLMWQHRAQGILWRLGARLRFTPGWAVGWWFIPIANLFQPYRAMRELYTTSLPDPDGHRARRAPKVVAWWVLFIGAQIVGGVAVVRARPSPTADPTIDDLVAGSTLSIAGQGLWIVAALLAVAVMLDVTRGQAALVEELAAFEAAERTEAPR